MNILVLPFVFIFGSIIGSFLNVVSLRHNTGIGLNGRSMCMSCGKKLNWFELIPIISFIIQLGSCRKCGSKISLQYPLVEFLTGLIFVLILYFFFPTSLFSFLKVLIYLVITCILLVISVYDLKHKIIPDIFVYVFSFFSLLSLFIGNQSFQIPDLGSIISGPLLALPFALIWFFSKGTWMGLGDAKLTLGIGWLLGFSNGVNSIVIAFWIACVVVLTWVFVVYRSFKPKMEIPFGPFLIVGMYLVLFFKIQVIDISLLKIILFDLFI